MHEQVRNRVVVVTGGSAGVGRATVEAFAGDGWDVGIIARDPGRLERAADSVRAAGRQACTVSPMWRTPALWRTPPLASSKGWGRSTSG